MSQNWSTERRGICERWNASHVAYEYAAPRPAVISGERGKIPDAFDALGLAVDARHGVVALASVDQILEMWVAMPRASAIDYRPTYHVLQCVLRDPRLDGGGTSFDPQSAGAA